MTNLWSPARQMAQFWSRAIPYLRCRLGIHVEIVLCGSSVAYSLDRLHLYLTDVAHVDIYWFIGSRLNQAPSKLPGLSRPLQGSSTVPWRYHFNTGTPRPNHPRSPPS